MQQERGGFMICERCPRKIHLLQFYDPVTECSVTLCQRCFKWFANGRRKGGLPIPNARKLWHTTMEKITV